MSRVTLKSKNVGQHIVVGIDPPTGSWFAQLWYDGKDEEFPKKELDTRSNGKLLETLQEWGVDETDERTKAAVSRIMCDFDPDASKKNDFLISSGKRARL